MGTNGVKWKQQSHSKATQSLRANFKVINSWSTIFRMLSTERYNNSDRNWTRQHSCLAVLSQCLNTGARSICRNSRIHTKHTIVAAAKTKNVQQPHQKTPQKAAIKVNNSQAQKLKRLKSTGRLRHMHGYILEVIAARRIYFGIWICLSVSWKVHVHKYHPWKGTVFRCNLQHRKCN